MKRAMAGAGLVLGLLGTACGSSNGTAPGSCSATVSGAASATMTCQIAVATTASTSGKVSFGMEGTASGNTQIIAVSVVLNQTSLQTGTYGSSTGTSVTSAATSFTMTTGASWAQFFDFGGVPNQGTFSLTIGSTGSSVPSGSYVGWPDPDGSFTATLPAETGTGATGTVTVSATF